MISTQTPCDWAADKRDPNNPNNPNSHVCFDKTLRVHEGDVYSCSGLQCRKTGPRQDEASDMAYPLTQCCFGYEQHDGAKKLCF